MRKAVKMVIATLVLVKMQSNLLHFRILFPIIKKKISDAIVSLAVQRISDLLINEALFLKDVKEQVESLKDKLKRMQCFLENVDCQPEQDKRLRNRVSEIRDLAYDAEDVIDSFILERAHQGGFLKAAHQGGFHGVVKRFTKPSHLHKIGVHTQAIETKLKSICDTLPAFEIPGDAADSGSISTFQYAAAIKKNILASFPRNKTDSHACPKAFEKLGREMVKKCGGLPLAIVVLGGLLATKQTGPMGDGSMKHLPRTLERVPTTRLSIWCEDWEISKKELIRLWIAEGFISPSLKSRVMLMEDVGEQFLEELMNRSLVQVVRRDYTGTNVKTCRIHDLLRDLFIEKARDEKFLEIVQPLLTGSDLKLTEPMLRRIAIHPSKRVLTIVEKYGEKWHVSSEIGNIRRLRYLKLYGKEIILPRAIGSLKSLHTLYLQYIGSLVIPDVVSMLERSRHFVLCSPDITGDKLYSDQGLSNLRSLEMRFKRAEDVKPILMSPRELQRLASLYMQFQWGQPHCIQTWNPFLSVIPSPN
ncbi:hypothetical protein F3Y22_tig00110020pilonHSYRG00506 [Hibiscus syriacus]|uniref:Rx N-terminal domain-containing protein n=1 Tax=Hibiscus syriacus TaxID=106335 RepID=A0A6A3BQ99_HIBSY|nr:hypothetical protein F3Y22_tig00110020pilonHSYRG00506 [Hibiscus syriacus]